MNARCNHVSEKPDPLYWRDTIEVVPDLHIVSYIFPYVGLASSH
jgi:hypothetical protein